MSTAWSALGSAAATRIRAVANENPAPVEPESKSPTKRSRSIGNYSSISDKTQILNIDDEGCLEEIALGHKTASVRPEYSKICIFVQ